MRFAPAPLQHNRNAAERRAILGELASEEAKPRRSGVSAPRRKPPRMAAWTRDSPAGPSTGRKSYMSTASSVPAATVDAPLTDTTSRPPVTIRRKDYRPPDYLAPSVHLKFDLDPSRTVVTSSVRYVRRDGAAADAPLRLDGEGLDLLTIVLDGKALERSRYSLAGDTLVLTPPLIITEDQIGEIIEKVIKVIRATA